VLGDLRTIGVDDEGPERPARMQSDFHATPLRGSEAA
jgi:hypothetical protein